MPNFIFILILSGVLGISPSLYLKLFIKNKLSTIADVTDILLTLSLSSKPGSSNPKFILKNSALSP